MTDKIAAAAAKVKKPKKVSNSRPARWARAVSEGQDALAEAVEARDVLNELRKTIEEVIQKARDQAETDRVNAALATGMTGDQILPGPKLEPIDDAVEADKEVIAAVTAFEDHLATVNEKLQDLSDLKDEYDEWKGNLPDSLQNSPVGEKLDAVTQINIDGDLDIDNFEDAENTFGECEGADLPLGFGKD